MGYSPRGRKESDTAEPLNKEQVDLSQLTTSLFASLDKKKKKKKILGKKAILIILIFLFFILFFPTLGFGLTAPVKWFFSTSPVSTILQNPFFSPHLTTIDSSP